MTLLSADCKLHCKGGDGKRDITQCRALHVDHYDRIVDQRYLLDIGDGFKRRITIVGEAHYLSQNRIAHEFAFLNRCADKASVCFDVMHTIMLILGSHNAEARCFLLR